MRTLLCFGLLAVLTGCPPPAKKGSEPLPPTPVTVLSLERSNPVRSLRLTGSVEAWKQESVSFSVGGRVEWTTETGAEVRGPAVDGEGEEVEAGSALARLDARRYELSVRADEAGIRATEAKTLAIKTEVEKVLTQELLAAESNRDRAQKDLARYRDLVEKGAAEQSGLDRAEAEASSLQAQVGKVEASIQAKQAELAASYAQLDQQREALHRSRLDLDECTLKAPFDARVAALHVISGAVVSAGQPVASLVVMDPMVVEIMVSPETDRTISYGDSILIDPPGGEHEPLMGIVMYKETVADAATRTFKVTIMVRNSKVFETHEQSANLPRVEDMSRVERSTGRYRSKDPNLLAIDVEALQHDARGYHVWRVLGRQAPPARRRQIEAVERVDIVPGTQQISLLGFLYRTLKDPGRLAENDILIRGKAPAGLEDGDRILFLRERWLLRPGDLVDVVLTHPTSEPGLHLPIEAILQEGGRHHVFVLDGPEGTLTARKVSVRVVGGIGELKRVEGTGLAEGMRVVLHGAHQVVSGDRVAVVPAEEAPPSSTAPVDSER